MLTNQGSYVTIGSFKLHKAWIILIGCCFLQKRGHAGAHHGLPGKLHRAHLRRLGCGRSEISVFNTAYWLSMIPALPVAGRILAKYDTRKVMTVSTLAVALAAGAMGFYTAPWMWICSGIVFGTFGCCVFTIPLVSMIGNWLHKRTGVAMGIATAVSALAIVVLSPFLQGCISQFGWRNAFFVEALIVVVFALPWTIFVFRDEPAQWDAEAYGLDDQANAELQERTGLDFHGQPGVPLMRALRSVPFVMLFLFAGIAAMIGSGFDSHLPGYANSLGLSAEFGAYLVSALSIRQLLRKADHGVGERPLRRMGGRDDGVRHGVRGRGGASGAARSHVAAGVHIPVRRAGLVHQRVAAAPGAQGVRQPRLHPDILVDTHGRRHLRVVRGRARRGLRYDVTGSYTPAFLGAFVGVLLGAAFVFVTFRTMRTLVWVDDSGHEKNPRAQAK